MATAQSPNSLSPKALVEAMYEAYGAQDEAKLRELLAPDVIWNQCQGFPGGARRRGVDDVLAGVLRGNRALWKGFSAKITEFIASGDRVVALGRYAGTHSESGQEMEAVFAHVYRVASGRIQEFEQITDTWPMVAAARGEAL